MIPINPLEHQNAMKTLYSKCVAWVCQKHRINRMELDILLFLANNPCYDTATDIVEVRCLSKSQVSASISTLEEHGFLKKMYTDGNRKTAHLILCDAASEIVTDGHKAQERFAAIMLEGLSKEELDCMKRCMEHMQNNIHRFLKEEGK